MKFISKKQTIERENSEICKVTEYSIESQALDFAIVKISGKYPASGYATNLISSEIVYVQAGEGQVTVNGITQTLKQGDVILIEPKEKFIWEGKLELHIACHPAFDPAQHVVIG